MQENGAAQISPQNGRYWQPNGHSLLGLGQV